jgi:hypothetical protein
LDGNIISTIPDRDLLAYNVLPILNKNNEEFLTRDNFDLSNFKIDNDFDLTIEKNIFNLKLIDKN